MTLLAKRYQQNPQGGFPTFQMDVQMQSSIINHVAKGFYFFEKGSYFLTIRDSYFLTMLLFFDNKKFSCPGTRARARARYAVAREPEKPGAWNAVRGIHTPLRSP